MIGFLSLLVHPIPALRSFGMYAALGVAIASARGRLAAPMALRSLRPGPGASAAVADARAGLYGMARAASRSILFALAIVSVLLLQQWTHATIDNDPLRVLPHDSEFRQTTDEMVARLGGVEQFGILVPRESIETPSTTTQQDGAPRSATRGATRARDDRDQRLAVLVAELKQRPEIVRFLRQPLRSASGEFLLRATLAPSGSTERLALFDAIKDLADQWELPGVRAVGSAVQIARDSDRPDPCPAPRAPARGSDPGSRGGDRPALLARRAAELDPQHLAVRAALWRRHVARRRSLSRDRDDRLDDDGPDRR
jgi:hypothetical protein